MAFEPYSVLFHLALDLQALVMAILAGVWTGWAVVSRPAAAMRRLRMAYASWFAVAGIGLLSAAVVWRMLSPL